MTEDTDNTFRPAPGSIAERQLRDALRAPDTRDIEAMERAARRAQEAARKLRAVEQRQTGGIRGAAKAKAKRKSAKAARRQNR